MAAGRTGAQYDLPSGVDDELSSAPAALREAGPLRGDMAPQSDQPYPAARTGILPPPPPEQAPLMSSRRHQTHDLSRALRQLTGEDAGWQQGQPSPPLGEGHIRLAVEAYNLGKRSCVKRMLPSVLSREQQAAMSVWAPVPAPAPVPAAPSPVPSPAPAVPAVAVSPSGKEEVAPILGRSAIRAAGGRSYRPTWGQPSALKMMGRTADPSRGLPPVLSPDRLAAMKMKMVKDMIEQHQKTYSVFLSMQNQGLQDTLEAERKFVANFLGTSDAQDGRDETSSHEDDADPGEVGHEADYSTSTPEGVQVASATSTTPAAVGADTASTPFARSPVTTDPPQCPPFNETAAQEALVQDSRVVMNMLMGVALKLSRTALREEGPAELSTLPERRTLNARSRGGQMMHVVRAIAGSQVRFDHPLSLLEGLVPDLERLQDLLKAGLDQGPGHGGTEDYNLTVAFTALHYCTMKGAPGFRMEQGNEELEGGMDLSPITIVADTQQNGAVSSVVLRLHAILEHIWDFYIFFFNQFIHWASRFHLPTDENVRVISLNQSELHGRILRALSSLNETQWDDLRRILSETRSEAAELRYAVSEMRLVTSLVVDIGRFLLTAGPAEGQDAEAGPVAVIRQIGDALLAGLHCFISSLAGTWTPSPAGSPADAPTLPATASRPGCESLEELSQRILDDTPIFAEMMYKVWQKAANLFQAVPESRGAAAARRLDIAASSDSLSRERAVRVVAGSSLRWSASLETVEEYVTRMEPLLDLLLTGVDRVPPDHNHTPADGQVPPDHNLTSAVEQMTFCFVDYAPGLKFEKTADARSTFSPEIEIEEVLLQRTSTVSGESSVALRFSILCVSIWNNYVPIIQKLVLPHSNITLQPLTSVWVLSLRPEELRRAISAAILTLSPEQQAELWRRSAQLAAADPQLQSGLADLKDLMTPMADITEHLLTSGRQAVSAGPAAVIRLMGYALLRSLACFSAGLAGSEPAAVWSTPPPPAVPPPPPAEPPTEPPQCLVLERANSHRTILEHMNQMNKLCLDVGLRFLSMFIPEPEPFDSRLLPGSESVPESVRGSVRGSRSATGSQTPGGDRRTQLMDSIQLSAGWIQLILWEAEQITDKLRQLTTLLAGGAASPPLGRPESDHNLTAALTALPACFVKYERGYHLEETLGAKTADTETLEIPPLERRSGDTDSVTLGMTNWMAEVWHFCRQLFAIFVRPCTSVTLQPEKNLRVLKLSRPCLQSAVLAAISGLDRIQRAELERVLRQLVSPRPLYVLGDLKQQTARFTGLSQLTLTKARQREAVAGPAAIVVNTCSALADSPGCFLAALAGVEEAETPGLPPLATEIPATAPPGVEPIPGVPLAGATSADPPPQDTGESAAGPGDESAGDAQDDASRDVDPFLSEAEAQLVNDILGGHV